MLYEFVKTVKAKNGKSADVYEVVDMIFKGEEERFYSAHPVGEKPTKNNSLFMGMLVDSVAQAKRVLNEF